ncbi:type 1 glutamine amidotransferase domain-containing protein [Fulvivirga sp. 29W222]|uniref:Type 1 glutamine amidotransferase domain-containing protein n=1 Tax=Fulvivirga marina TaxID=2494733 RepID=A0A937KF41_9BACT|nr:type 1 glutamine amidotransferase domain-containing protein [Fulvivirga marina]MBL6447813.1 type 1 glutamine amidotransferase domain-containing protein [Fulvivirga marina]
MKRVLNAILLVLAAVVLGHAQKVSGDIKGTPRVLMVLSSHGELGNTGKETGFYLSEATHAYEVFKDRGFVIDVVSPEGGKAPVDGFDLKDSVNKKFWNDKEFRHKVENTLTPDEVKAGDYDAIYYAGGHGTMWDFPENEKLAQIAADIYENNGVVSAVCHGPIALVNIKLSNGEYLVHGKTVSVFTNEEESAIQLTEVVPYLLEEKMKERGVTVEKAGMWQEKVSVDNRLVTGQNPASAHKVAAEVVQLVNSVR